MKRSSKRTSWLWLAVAMAGALSLIAVGCNDLGDANVTTSLNGTTTSVDVSSETATTEAVAETTLSPTTTVSHTPSTSTASEKVMTNGHIKACGIITRVWMDGSTRKIEIDYVDYLTGAEAVAAAAAAGEEAVNDYWVRNENSKLRTFTVSNSAAITLDDRSLPPAHLVPLSWAEFSAAWGLTGEEAVVRHSLWWIERSGTTVVRIDQQFQP
jgi:hypothetical protein